MKRIALIVIPLCLFLADCKKIKQTFYPDQTVIDPCDQMANYYEGDVHFIERDFVNDDRNIDYGRMFEADKVHKAPCDPIHGTIHKQAK